MVKKVKVYALSTDSVVTHSATISDDESEQNIDTLIDEN